MRIISTLLFFLTACLFSNTSYAQALYAVAANEKIDNATLIVEGKVTSQQSFWNPKHTMIYTSNKVQVYKKFKGDAIPNEIEVLTQGGSVGLESITASDLLELDNGQTGIFFCNQNSIGLKNPATGNLLWDVYGSSQGFLAYSDIDGSANAPFARYKNITTDLYQQIEKRTGRTAQVIDPAFNPIHHANIIDAVSVTSFSPTSVNAGATLDPATNLLTINGTGFGTATGTAAVLFDDANDGTAGNYITVLWSDPLIVSWSATQIQVRVPSRAGTGLIYVKDDGGTAMPSPTTLNVVYSILTATFTSGSTVTKESNLINTNGAGGYSILYSTSTAGGGVDLNASATKTTFQRALTTWQKLAGFNVLEAGTTTSQQINPSDGLNVMMFDNTNTGNAPLAAGVLATCYSFNSMCTPVTTNEVRKTEFDIVIRNSGVSSGATTFTLGPCPPSTSEIDMESVVLHELGHALNLGHINDTYEGVSFPNINPGKLMNYAILTGSKRSSPDYSAYAGALYATKLQGNAYGSCPSAFTEMTRLTLFSEPKDECPVTFPTASISGNISVDLNLATSNKFGDPQSSAVNCAGTVTSVTNTAFYAFKTNGNSRSVAVSVSNYATTPAAQSACSGAGVRLTLYQTSSCPTGQAFPSPLACQTFNANGAISPFTGLTANTLYLLMMSGVTNTKASFTLSLFGTVLPIKIEKFTGALLTNSNQLAWNIANTEGVNKTILESSIDGANFYPINEKLNTASKINIEDGYNDIQIAAKKYYRLKVVNKDGSSDYSAIVVLTRDNVRANIIISPNPAADKMSVTMLRANVGVVNFTILDMAGKKILFETHTLAAGYSQLMLSNLEKLSKGTYVLRIDDNGSSSTHKIMIGQ